jgi:phosphinothricin acetyltransferase
MLAIYAPVVLETAASFELTPPSKDEFQRRIRDVSLASAWLVADRDGRILGYAHASKFRPRPAYQWTAEVTVYVAAKARGQGVARSLYQALLEILRLQGFVNAVAVITVPNPSSVRLHEALGFRPVGLFRSVGYKLGAWHDVGWWQLALQEPMSLPAPPRTLPEALTSPDWPAAVRRPD